MAKPLIVPATGRHTATLIFAHGLGDTGLGWLSAVENWRRRQRLNQVKFVLPHAPHIPVTCNGVSWPAPGRLPGSFPPSVLCLHMYILICVLGLPHARLVRHRK